MQMTLEPFCFQRAILLQTKQLGLSPKLDQQHYRPLYRQRKVLGDSLHRKVEIDEATRRLRLRTKNGSEDLLTAAGALKNAKIKAEELSVHGPSLDDVFLAVTGKKAEEE